MLSVDIKTAETVEAELDRLITKRPDGEKSA
jgi:hypothetical protein